MRGGVGWLATCWLGAGTVLWAAAPALPELARFCAEGNESLWRSCSNPPPKLSSRGLFAYALALCESDQHLERLERLFVLAAQMQDRDPRSRHYGNFRWYWSDERVADANAVDFCMRAGPRLWSRFRERMTPAARARLKELLEISAHGLLGHEVAESYSNIALMNAGGLILLGEALGRPEVADEGYARLDRFVFYTWESGVHEFDSPTYTGVDLDCLGLIEAAGQREPGRAAARALLELFWTDVALNWFPPAQKLAGAHSRTYDYLRGLGYLDVQLALQGWISDPLPKDPDILLGASVRWHPAPAMRELSGRFPRLVRQGWGPQSCQSRTHYLLAGITLSSLGTSYGGRMDMPLTVDWPGPRASVRGYFIADGRDDPYGKKKIAAGPHQKAFHLNPFWAAAQRRGDALGLVLYREKDLVTNTTTVVSDFVLPADADGFFVGDQAVSLAPHQPVRVPVGAGQTVVVRQGRSALGLRVLWARGLDGRPAPMALVYDGNPFGAVRLAVEHVPPGTNPVFQAHCAGAAFWARVADGLDSDGALAAWRRQFANATTESDVGVERLRFRVAGTDGPVALTASVPWAAPEALEPAPSRAVLELDGTEVGRPLLQGLPSIRASLAALERAVLDVPAAGGLYWEAESGVLKPRMTTGRDSAASGGQFIWMPGEAGGRGANAHGSATWRLRVARAGDYYLWGRILTPTPSDDSFFLHAATSARTLVESAAWQPGVHPRWDWVPVSFDNRRQPAPWSFPAGEARLEVRVREDGAKLDRLFLTADPTLRPE